MISISLAIFVLVLALSGAGAQTKCFLDNDCYCDVTQSPKIDYVFVLDASGSMQDEIDSLAAGLSTLVAEIAERELDATFTLIIDGTFPELLLETSTDADLFKQLMAAVVVGPPHNNPESELETLQMSLGVAKHRNAMQRGASAPGDGVLALRPDAKPFFLVLTDEDDDAPTEFFNRYENQTSEEPWGCGPTAVCGVNINGNFVQKPCPDNICILDSEWTYYHGPWALFLNDTANALLEREALLFMFMSEGAGMSRKQYGAPSCGADEQLGLSIDLVEKVERCLEQIGSEHSLEAQMLRGGRVARTFDILSVLDADFVQSVLRFAVQVAGQCTARKRQSTSDCILRRCIDRTCKTLRTCAAGCNQCMINGECRPAFSVNPAANCSFCLPTVSKSAWATCAGAVPGASCLQYECVSPEKLICQTVQQCDASCQRCSIDGACVAAGTLWKGDPCQGCVPSENDRGWSPVCAPTPLPATTAPPGAVQTDAPAGSALPPAAIMGIVFAALFCCMIVAAVLFLVRQKKRGAFSGGSAPKAARAAARKQQQGGSTRGKQMSSFRRQRREGGAGGDSSTTGSSLRAPQRPGSGRASPRGSRRGGTLRKAPEPEPRLVQQELASYDPITPPTNDHWMTFD